ncbi:MAG: hypothetical protein ACKO4S_10510, partial [Snowella sp.]
LRCYTILLFCQCVTPISMFVSPKTVLFLDQNNLTLYDVLMAKDLLYLFATIDMESVEQFKESDRIKESIRY